MMKIWAGLIILGLLSSCGEYTTQLEPGRCKETSDSVQRRSAFILSCANLYASTAPQMEQKEDIIDECSTHSFYLKIEDCDKPTLQVKIPGDNYRDCAGINNTKAEAVCKKAYESYKEKGLIVY